MSSLDQAPFSSERAPPPLSSSDGDHESGKACVSADFADVRSPVTSGFAIRTC